MTDEQDDKPESDADKLLRKALLESHQRRKDAAAEVADAVARGKASAESREKQSAAMKKALDDDAARRKARRERDKTIEPRTLEDRIREDAKREASEAETEWPEPGEEDETTLDVKPKREPKP